MRVALCFWGLCRSTHLTIASIEQQIFSVLREAGIQVDVYIHTYSITRPYTNPRSGEYELQLRNSSWKYLQPKTSLVEDQDEVDKHLHFSAYRSRGNPWADEVSQQEAPWHTLDNHLRALWSLKQVTVLWKASNKPYDWIVYLRPDVRYLSPFDIGWFEKLESKSVGCPDFQQIAGCNDRFAVCQPRMAEVYGTRFNKALEYSRQKPLHSETFLADTMTMSGATFVPIAIRFVRIRADGQLCPADME
jgi:hypothetical protein